MRPNFIKNRISSTTASHLANVIVYFLPSLLQYAGERRIERAVYLAEASVIPQDDPLVFRVLSQSHNRTVYTVDLHSKTCTCPDTAIVCKHRIAVAIRLFGSGYMRKLKDQFPNDKESLEHIITGQFLEPA